MKIALIEANALKELARRGIGMLVRVEDIRSMPREDLSECGDDALPLILLEGGTQNALEFIARERLHAPLEIVFDVDRLACKDMEHSAGLIEIGVRSLFDVRTNLIDHRRVRNHHRGHGMRGVF